MKVGDESRGKYQHIRDELAKAIRGGRLAPKQKLPSENQLAAKYAASRGTVLRALLDLSHAGLIERRRGSGTYVTFNAGRTGGKFALIAHEMPDQPEKRQGDVLGIILRNIAEEAGRRGYSLIHHTLPESAATRKEDLWPAVNDVIEQRSAGAMFLPLPTLSSESQVLNREIARCLAKANVPTVLLDCDLTDGPERSNLDLVSANNQQGGAALTEHLLQQGCRRIGFIRNVHASTISERICGYRETLLKQGIQPDPNWVRLEQELSQATLKELIGTLALDGLIFKDDALAAVGCRHLAALGYRVGVDIKVAGFDDSPIAALLSVPLTTIRQPIKGIALNAVNLLLDRIQNPNQPCRSVLVNCDLIVRESTLGPSA
jgi:DNA-binding LacI/PurR family transcriptional regulator